MPMVPWKKTLTIPSLRKNDHRTGLWDGMGHTVLRHYVRYCDESFPEALPKFWRPAGWKKYFFKNTMRKLRSIAFQRCILRGGLPLVEVSQNKDFLQKTASKTGFLRDTKLDQLTLEGAGTPNFKSTDIFDMFPENLGAKAFRWAIGKPAGVNIVRTAGRYFAQGGRTRKIAKKYIFCFFRFSSKILWRKILPG